MAAAVTSSMATALTSPVAASMIIVAALRCVTLVSRLGGRCSPRCWRARLREEARLGLLLN